MEELVNKINGTIALLQDNLQKNLDGNKAAGQRARKNTLELEKLFKEYRKLSVK